MNAFFKVNIIIAICFLITACGEIVQNTSAPTAPVAPSQPPIVPIESTSTQIAVFPLPTTTPDMSVPTVSYIDGTSAPSQTPNPKIPTFLPTIDPNSVPELLRNAITLKLLDGVNGHTINQITGWNYGFSQYGPGRRPCNGYQWLDSTHLLLYPRTGEGMVQYLDGSSRTDLSSQFVVINLTNGSFWLLQPQPHTTHWDIRPDCDFAYWSQELGIIISQENSEAIDSTQKETISIYTFDGEKIAQYPGKISGVSPKGTKILIDNTAIIDLQKNKITNLTWNVSDDTTISSKLYWSADENRVYRCCFYFADLKTGKSYNLEWSDLRGIDGKPIPFTLMSPHVGGRWVRNDTYFFPTWSYMSDIGDPRIIFSPIEKKYYFIELPSASVINPETMTYTFSPDGMYAWITGFSYGNGKTYSFLVNLTTLEATPYDISGNDFFWSPDSKYGWVSDYDKNINYILSVTSKKLEPFPINPDYYDEVSWHPKENILAYMTESNQTLTVLNAEDITIQGWKLPFTTGGPVWSPNGDRMAFSSKDRAIRVINYPEMNNLEQIIQPLDEVSYISWSPDGNSIAFVSGTDIYIVETTK